MNRHDNGQSGKREYIRRRGRDWSAGLGKVCRSGVCMLICLLSVFMLTGCGKQADKSVDVDLTSLSATMVYSEVYNMLLEPEKYVDKKIRMEGICAAYHSSLNNRDYYSCIIEDATACCSQGIEFILDDGYTFPDDYPADGKEIELKGVFEIYEEDGYEFCRIRDAKLI